jgi:D-alanyl-D-alanine carboxypeptidase (penicillin-binding protein 5/6)
MLVASLNDAANAISRSIAESVRDGNGNPHIAIDLMNASARRLGLSQTVFYNEDGLDIGKEQSGAVGSAEDVAKVFSALLSEYPETLAPTRLDGYALRSLGGNIYQYWNTNQHLADIPGALGSKTGYTTLADGNLAVALKKGEKTFVIVLLGSSKEGRFQDVSRIARFLSEHTLSSLFEEHDIVGAS